MDYDNLIKLIEKAEANSASEDELIQLDKFYASFENREGYTDRVQDFNTYQQSILSKINTELGIRKAVKYHLWYWMGASVAAAVVLIVAGLYLFGIGQEDRLREKPLVLQSITPGRTGATLTLANGKQIRLAEAANGSLAQQANVSIIKTVDGQLVYQISGSAEGAAHKHFSNTLTTARGEIYDIRLPDGSVVSMNAASSLTYSSTLLEAGLRKVKLEGEAYFQVAKDAAHPFIVESRGQEIRVLGTHFNVNAYSDEPVVKTTLVEGRINVNGYLLMPNQQSILNNGRIRILNVDTEAEIAWKHGKFVFESETLGSIMRKVSRWYNVDVEIEEGLARKTFTGSLRRIENVSKLLHSIELTNMVNIKIEGRRVIVSK